MSLYGTLGARGGRVAAQHAGIPPAGQPHQVLLLAARSEPAVSEGVPQLVRMEFWESGLATAALERLGQAAAEARGEELSPEELQRRAVSLRKSYMQRLAREREQRRKAAGKTKSPTAAASAPGLQKEVAGGINTDAPAEA